MARDKFFQQKRILSRWCVFLYFILKNGFTRERERDCVACVLGEFIWLTPAVWKEEGGAVMFVGGDWDVGFHGLSEGRGKGGRRERRN